MAHQRCRPPALCDEGKHAVLDPIPLPGSGRKMRHVHVQAGEICQPLQLPPAQRATINLQADDMDGLLNGW